MVLLKLYYLEEFFLSAVVFCSTWRSNQKPLAVSGWSLIGTISFAEHPETTIVVNWCFINELSGITRLVILIVTLENVMIFLKNTEENQENDESVEGSQRFKPLSRATAVRVNDCDHLLLKKR